MENWSETLVEKMCFIIRSAGYHLLFGGVGVPRLFAT